MRTSVRAFTLLELLIVLIIISVVVLSASLMLSNDHRSEQNLKTAVDLFKSRLSLAQQEAVLSTSTLGVAISSKGYLFYRYTETLPNHKWVWQPLNNDKALNYHAWPNNSEVALALNQQMGTLLGDDFAEAPQIIFYSSNQITPFIMVINDKYQIVGSDDGKIIAGSANA